MTVLSALPVSARGHGTPLRIAIATDDPGWHGKRLRRAFEARQVETCYVSLLRCRFDLANGIEGLAIPGFEETLPDGVFVRGVPGGTLDQVVLRLDFLHALRELDIPVYNDPRAIERTVDKGMTSFLVQRAGLLTPPTVVTESSEQAGTFLREEIALGHEVVAKPLFGSQGVGLRRLKALADLPRPEECNGVWYLQRYVETGPGDGGWHDWRVFVISGKAIAAMVRRGTSWVNNVAQGGRCEAVPLEGDLQRLAVAACAAVGTDYAGVDLVRGEGGELQVLEVNSMPAWKGLQSVTQPDIAQGLVDDFLSRRVAVSPRR
ncbi:MAG TPA: RimK family alpha-L-glutamate ligase [Gemmatimonadales bacterium]|jgi:RimK family alpha-L-glutamate ligase|nr:RimK family alpha-L-glutamate ligase [Gemmatimonadales bacterium]